MGVAAKDEVEKILREFVGYFGGMRQQHGAGALRYSGCGGGEVVGVVKMGIVDACEPKPLTIAFDEGRFIEKHG